MNQENKPDEPQFDPTKSELEILQVLWQHGPSTVRFVNNELNKSRREVQYTSTLKLMQIMVEKKMLGRDQTSMMHVYFPLMEEKETKGRLLDRFVDSLFGGSPSSLMMQLLGNKRTSRKELHAIKELLEKFEKK